MWGPRQNYCSVTKTKIYVILAVLTLALCQSVLADNATLAQMGVATTPQITITNEVSNITSPTTMPITSAATTAVVTSASSPTMTTQASTSQTTAVPQGSKDADFTYKINDVITNGNEIYAVWDVNPGQGAGQEAYILSRVYVYPAQNSVYRIVNDQKVTLDKMTVESQFKGTNFQGFRDEQVFVETPKFGPGDIVHDNTFYIQIQYIERSDYYYNEVYKEQDGWRVVGPKQQLGISAVNQRCQLVDHAAAGTLLKSFNQTPQTPPVTPTPMAVSEKAHPTPVETQAPVDISGQATVASAGTGQQAAVSGGVTVRSAATQQTVNQKGVGAQAIQTASSQVVYTQTTSQSTADQPLNQYDFNGSVKTRAGIPGWTPLVAIGILGLVIVLRKKE
jgi:hypothetical protein